MRFLWILILVGLVGCTGREMTPAEPGGEATEIRATDTRVTVRSTATPSAAPPIRPFTVTPAPASLSACSPLDGIPLSDLPGMIFNPYQPPPPGRDDPHEGVDLAVLLPGAEGHVAVSGQAVAAVLPGTVAMAQPDRFPYGNALIIETRIKDLPVGWPDLPAAPLAGQPTLEPVSALTCTALPAPAGLDPQEGSLYLVYAHLRDAPALAAGDVVGCGEIIGAVGESGNALNPHLHLEARVGPAGLNLKRMAHYDPSASSEEMGAYCLWRVSGLFVLVDPMEIIGEERE